YFAVSDRNGAFVIRGVPAGGHTPVAWPEEVRALGGKGGVEGGGGGGGEPALRGRGPCRAVRYRLTSGPLYVHCCHCRWCQRETGTAFALNALIEAERVVLLQGEPEGVYTPPKSGKGQKIFRCTVCRVAVWSNYGGAVNAVLFVRVGTLEEPDR